MDLKKVLEDLRNVNDVLIEHYKERNNYIKVVEKSMSDDWDKNIQVIQALKDNILKTMSQEEQLEITKKIVMKQIFCKLYELKKEK